MVIKWIGEFQAANKQPGEEVAFDVLCGDFNFDNCSPGSCLAVFHKVIFYPFIVEAALKCFSFSLDDSKEQNHRIFEEYRDPCRAGPGREKPWVIGV